MPNGNFTKLRGETQILEIINEYLATFSQFKSYCGVVNIEFKWGKMRPAVSECYFGVFCDFLNELQHVLGWQATPGKFHQNSAALAFEDNGLLEIRNYNIFGWIMILYLAWEQECHIQL